MRLRNIRPRPDGTPRAVWDFLFAAAFVAALMVPATATFWRCGDPAQFAEEWNRIVGRFSWEHADRFRSEVGGFFDTHFGFREELVEMNALATIAAFGESPSRKVLIGRDGWLFYAPPGYMDDFRGLHPFSPDELERWTAALGARRDFLADRGIAYLFVVAPNKQVVYPEMVPERFNRIGTVTHTDALFASLGSQDFPVDALDLRDSQLAARKEATSYYPLDTHWNFLGAYYGYRAIMERLERSVPGVRAMAPERIGWEDDWKPWAGLNDMMGLRREPEPDAPLKRYVIENPTASLPPTLPEDLPALPDMKYAPDVPLCYNVTRSPGEKPRALLIHDSFSMPLVPLLAEHFSLMVAIWEEIGRERLEQAIETYHPDIVIEERLDRFLQHSPELTPEISGRLFRSSFDNAEKIRLTLSSPAEFDRLKLANMTADAVGDGLRIEATDAATARMALPRVRYRRGESVALKLSMSRPTGGTSRLEWTTFGEKSKTETPDGRAFRIPEGESVLYLALPAASENGKIRFRFWPDRTGEMTIRRIEVRTTTRPGPRLAPDRESPYAL